MAEKVKCTNCNKLTDVIICYECLERDLAADHKTIEGLRKEMKERTRLWHNANVEVKTQAATIEHLRCELALDGKEEK